MQNYLRSYSFNQEELITKQNLMAGSLLTLKMRDSGENGDSSYKTLANTKVISEFSLYM